MPRIASLKSLLAVTQLQTQSVITFGRFYCLRLTLKILKDEIPPLADCPFATCVLPLAVDNCGAHENERIRAATVSCRLTEIVVLALQTIVQQDLQVADTAQEEGHIFSSDAPLGAR